MGKSKIGVYVSVILAMVLWGFTFIAFKYAYESFNPISITFIRLFVANFVLFGFGFLFRRLKKIKKSDLKWFLLMALFEPFFYFMGEAFGLTLVSATVGAVIISTIPLFTPYAAYLIFREKLTPMNKVGLVISFGGVLLVILVKGGSLAASPKGVLLLFLAVFSAVGYTMIAKKLIRDYNPLTITAYQGFIGMILFLPLFLIVDLPGLDIAGSSALSRYSVLYLGIFGSGICFVLFTIGLRELGATKANIFVNLIPVVTAILSFLLLKEAMPFQKILGIFIVIVGLLMSQIGRLTNNKLKRNEFGHPPYS